MKERQARWFREIIFQPESLLILCFNLWLNFAEGLLKLVWWYLVLWPHIPFLGRWLPGRPVWVWTDARSLTTVTVWLTPVKGHSVSLPCSSPPPSASFPNITVSPLGHCSTPALDPGIKSGSSALQADSLPSEPSAYQQLYSRISQYCYKILIDTINISAFLMRKEGHGNVRPLS